MTTEMTTEIAALTYRPNGHGLRVDLEALMVGGLLIQAQSGGGKSRAIRQLLEETHGRVQHIVFDPEGEFPSLREHFDYIHAAPHGGDVVATPKTARVLCRRLVELGASAVLDIYDLKLEEKREFVRLFLEELMALPRSLWKPIIIVIDESDIFATQNGEASSTNAVIDVNGRGRKRGWRMVLTTRRLSRLHKDAADIPNRMIGRTGLDVDVKRAGDELGMDKDKRQTLPRLEPGQFYVYGPAISPVPVIVRTGEIRTSHPKAGRIGAVVPPAPAKVRAFIAQLADLPKEAAEEARTVDELRKHVAQLTKDNRELSKAATGTMSTPVLKQALLDEYRRGLADGAKSPAGRQEINRLRKALEAAMRFITNISTANFDAAGVDKAELERAIGAAVEKATLIVDQRLTARSKTIDSVRLQAQRIAAQLKAVLGDEEVVIDVAVEKNAPFTVKDRTPRAPHAPRASLSPAIGDGDAELPKGERITLVAIAQYPDGVDRDQLSVLTGYKRSSRDSYVQRLKDRGYVQLDGQRIRPTQEGLDALGSNFEPLPTGEALQKYWLERLPEGERKILEVLIEADHDTVDRESIDRATGYKRSSRDSYIQRLKARRLVVVEREGVRASDNLLEGGR